MIDVIAQSPRAVTDDGNWRFNGAETFSELGNPAMFHLQLQIAAMAHLHRL